MVRSCVSVRARVLMRPWDGPNATTTAESTCASFVLILFRSRTRNDAGAGSSTFFAHSRARRNSSSRGVFSRSVSLQSVALSRRPPAVLARRASSSPARRVSTPRSRPKTGDQARSRRFERAPPGSPRDRRFFPDSRRPRFFLARRFGEGGKTSEVQRSAWQPSVVFVSRLTLVLSRVSMLTASSRLERRAARRPSDDARATLRLLLQKTRSSYVMMMIRAARSRLQRFPSTPRPPTLVS